MRRTNQDLVHLALDLHRAVLALVDVHALLDVCVIHDEVIAVLEKLLHV